MKCRYLPDRYFGLVAVIALSLLVLLIAGCDDDDDTTGPGGVASAWTRVSPTIEGNLFRSADFVDASTGWLVGVDGVILKTTNSGGTWTEQASQTNGTLRGVDFVTPTVGWIVGDDGAILRTEDGGMTWSGPVIEVTGRRLNAVEGVTPRKALAVGNEGILYYTVDIGLRWTPDTVILNTPLRDIVVFDTSAVAVGDEGTIVRFFDYSEEIQRLMADTTSDTIPVEPDTLPVPIDIPIDTLVDTVLVDTTTTFDTSYVWLDVTIDTIYYTLDTLWAQHEVVTSGVTENLLGVTHVDGNVLWAVGDNGVILSSPDRGVTWTPLTSGVTTSLTSVINTNGTGIITGLDGTVLRSTDNGNTWNPVALGLNLDLYDATTPTSGSIWVVGDVAIYRSTDAGATWSRLASGTTSIPTLTDVKFVSPDSGFAVGYAGVILRTIDGGQNWETVRQGSLFSPDEWFSAVNFTDNLQGWAVGRAGLPPTYYLLVVRTSDGGESWERFAFPDVPPDPNDPPVPDTGWGQDVVFIDGSTGYVCADTNVFYTTNGGASWEMQVNPDTAIRVLHDLDFVDATHGWAVGAEGIVLRTTDGLTWEVAGSGEIDSTLFAVDFLTADTGIAVGANGNIWRTTDSGSTWTKISSPTQNTLVDVGFVDNLSGKAVGRFGAILSTNDGGLTWVVQPAPTMETLTAVDMVSSNVGWIVGAYSFGESAMMLYTTTGGN